MKPLILVLLVLLVSCGTQPGTTQSLGTTPNTIEVSQSRFTVTYVGAFAAGSADYKAGNHRAVYLIVDHTTGQELVGIEGIGVSGLGKHSKSQVEK